jgi:hypothetical protein
MEAVWYHRYGAGVKQIFISRKRKDSSINSAEPDQMMIFNQKTVRKKKINYFIILEQESLSKP